MHADTVLARSMASLSGLMGWSHGLQVAWRRRKVMAELATLDDHLLRDMGITRQDVESVLADPSEGDPTLRLAGRAREARWGRRASAREERRWATLLEEAEKPSASDRRAA